jgi:heptosyltransferase III
LCGLLKAQLGAHVIFLGCAYTRAVLEASSAVDTIVEWDDMLPATDQLAHIAETRADVLLHVFPRPAIARAAWAARVPWRVGTSHRLYHWLYCNRLEPLGRRRSSLHEAQLNVRLARSLLDAGSLALPPDALAPYGRLCPRVHVPSAIADLLQRDRFTLVVHPKSFESAREWPLTHYRALVNALPPDRFRVLITGTRKEGEAMREWLSALPPHAHDVTGRTTLAELIALLAAADGVVAASTGPLHIAAAVGTPALGLYPRRSPMNVERWAPLGPCASTLVPPTPCGHCGAGTGARPVDACACVEAVSVDAVYAHVEAWAAEGRVWDRAARRALEPNVGA